MSIAEFEHLRAPRPVGVLRRALRRLRKAPSEEAPSHQGERGPFNLMVTVVISAYNEEASIKDTVESIRKSSYPIYEIIVIDDSSSDNTGAVAALAGARVVRTDVNRKSKARAINFLLEQYKIKTDVIIIVDADTIPKKDGIEKLMRMFSDPSVGAASGFVIPQRLEGWYSLACVGTYFYVLTVIKPLQDRFGLVVVNCGCFGAYRTRLLVETGGFPPRTLAEDMDKTWQLRQLGWKIRYTAEAVCYPIEPPDFKTYVRQKVRWFCGTLQNIKERRFNLFPLGKAFAPYVYGMLLSNIIGTIILPVIVWYAVEAYRVGIVPMAALMFAFDLTFMGTVILYRGWKLGMLWVAVKSVIPSACMQYVDRVIFLYCVVKEWVFGIQLNTWNKGH